MGLGGCAHACSAPPQTLLLERCRVAQQPPGETNFNVFPLMLAGLDAAHRWVRGSRGTGRLCRRVPPLPRGSPVIYTQACSSNMVFETSLIRRRLSG